ncbi:uncharacterized protein BJX67DRAFT_380966 [Aspergillus lucknowensis]|uniref:Uncharacterized protein n=1 Tax=Aspergillus lucknowensis TaxID=176173 RepID=A0ABR4LSV7_9EURO
MYIRDIQPGMSWWLGELTDLNGYYFTDYGGIYCYEDDLGITAAIQPFVQGANGQAETADEIASIILCPYSFDNSPRPDSYRDANGLLAQGPETLRMQFRRARRSFMRPFTPFMGLNFWPVLTSDVNDIGTCLNLASQPQLAQANPENYVFFISHMYHILGEEDDNEPWSIPTNWDFQLMGNGQNRIFGAVQTT